MLPLGGSPLVSLLPRPCLTAPPPSSPQVNALTFEVAGTAATAVNVANGTPYSISIVACNAVGCSAPATTTARPNGSVPRSANPGAPVGPVAAAAPAGWSTQQAQLQAVRDRMKMGRAPAS